MTTTTTTAEPAPEVIPEDPLIRGELNRQVRRLKAAEAALRYVTQGDPIAIGRFVQRFEDLPLKEIPSLVGSSIFGGPAAGELGQLAESAGLSRAQEQQTSSGWHDLTPAEKAAMVRELGAEKARALIDNSGIKPPAQPAAPYTDRAPTIGNPARPAPEGSWWSMTRAEQFAYRREHGSEAAAELLDSSGVRPVGYQG